MDAMKWVASRTFTDDHMDEALTDDELRDRKELEASYQDEIRKVSNIVNFSETFKRLSLNEKLDIALSLIRALEKTKYLNIKMENRLSQIYTDTDIKSVDELINLLSSSKEISNAFQLMVNTLIKYKYILPDDIILLNQNISKLEILLSNLMDWMKQKTSEIQSVEGNRNTKIVPIEDKILANSQNNLYITDGDDIKGNKPKK